MSKTKTVSISISFTDGADITITHEYDGTLGSVTGVYFEDEAVCPDCGGTGEVTQDCEECRGEGEILCDNCHSSGESDCSSCDGAGCEDSCNSARCEDCAGSGVEDCLSCDGAGAVPCEDCEGTGDEMTGCDTCS